jgi:ubiquinone/menaquinone biosynthesis C-methylase UbiE
VDGAFRVDFVMDVTGKYLHGYDYRYWAARWQTERLDHLGKVIIGDGLVLDLGCGDVRLSVHAKNYVGVDLSDVACLKAKRSKVSFVKADVRHIPFKDECASIVVCAELLEHLQKPRDCLVEAGRVVRKKGKIVVTVPNPNQFRFLLRKMLGREGAKPDDLHLHVFTWDDVKMMLLESGFSVKWVTSICVYIPKVDMIVPQVVRRVLHKIMPDMGVYILAVGRKK